MTKTATMLAAGLAALLAACGGNAPEESASTAPATQAQAGGTEAAVPPAPEPAASVDPAATPIPTPTATSEVPAPAALAPAAAQAAASGAPGSAAPKPVVAAAPPPAFAICRSCHATEPGRNGIGPTLAGIVGSKAGEVPGYAFSPALEASGITWDRASLDTWLKGPTRMVPGTKMVLPVSDPGKRAAIIDYLETLK
ncbi:c-type cytochrome [Novosphingobium soli]|uniref:C-type cytochrome n=1 Tax=Novosphingobium soli TaxID=574956 RepID=A0ABV6CXU3_9SPHN